MWNTTAAIGGITAKRIQAALNGGKNFLEGDRMGRRTIYWTCPKCGANLDSNETCDCEEVARQERQKAERLLKVEEGTNQLTFNWEPESLGV